MNEEQIKPLSRQRRWQIAQKEKGNCITCANPSNGTSHCDECAKKSGVKSRHHERQKAWEQVDWTKSTKQLAAEFGITAAAVCMRRRRFGIPSIGRGRPKKLKPDNL